MSWETVRREQGKRGMVELQKFEQGRGRGRPKFVSWRILCEGAQVGYAAAERDVDVNFRRVLAGNFMYEPTCPCPDGDKCTGEASPGHPAHRQQAS